MNSMNLKLNRIKWLFMLAYLIFESLNNDVCAQQSQTRDSALIEKHYLDSIHKIWIVKTDSLIKLDRIDFTNYTRVGAYVNSEQGVLSFNTSLIIRKYRRYDFGMGAGLEYYNRSLGIIQLIQMPFVLTNHIYLTKRVYFLFEPGIMVPLSGYYYTGNGTLNEHTGKVNFSDSDFKPAFYYNIGLGLYNTANICVELVLRNQSNGILYPINERISMVGLNLGIKL